jgi:hypothetical protein
MSGDIINLHGSGNIGRATHSGSGDILVINNSVGQSGSESSINDLLKAINDLRQHVDDSRKAALDAAVQEINSDQADSKLTGPIEKIAGIAVLLGEIGVPVINAIQALAGSLSS